MRAWSAVLLLGLLRCGAALLAPATGAGARLAPLAASKRTAAVDRARRKLGAFRGGADAAGGADAPPVAAANASAPPVAAADADAAPAAASGEREILEEAVAPSYEGCFERRPSLPLARYCVVMRPSVVDDTDVAKMMGLFGRILDRDEDLTAFYDLREMKMGLRSRAALRVGGDWMARPENAVRLDARVKAVVILVRSPFIRGIARWCVRFCAPPAPVHLVRDEAEALAIAAKVGAS